MLALIIGFFCVRHTEIYFAMLTLAFGMMVFSLMWNLRSITGGDDGLYGITRTAISFGLFKISISKEYQYYFLVLFFFLASVFLIYRIYRSPFGLVLAGIRENHVRTEFAGLAVRRYRLGAFVVSGAFAGLAGTLAVLLESNITPFAAHWSRSAEPVLVSLIGGLHTFAGPLAGSIVFVVLREVVERFSQNWMFWFGILLLAIIMGFRGGIVGSTAEIFKRLSRGALDSTLVPQLRKQFMSEPLLEVRRLNKAFGMVVTAKDMDFSLQSGVLTSIIGPNGAGKSTLINLLTGSLLPDSGEIWFEGHDITHEPIHRRVRQGSVPLLPGSECIYQSHVVRERCHSRCRGKKKARSMLRPVKDYETSKGSRNSLDRVGLLTKADVAAAGPVAR